MEEKVLVESNMTYLKKMKAFFLRFLLVTGILIIVTLVAYSNRDKWWDEYYHEYYKYHDITKDMARNKAYFWLDFSERIFYVTLGFMGVSVIWAVFLFYSINMQLTVTNMRVYGKAAFGKRVDLPIDMITATGTTMFKGIGVSTASGKVRFIGISNRDIIFETINHLLKKRQQKEKNPMDSSGENKNDIAENILKYKKLLDAGAITSEEYEVLKKKTLDL